MSLAVVTHTNVRWRRDLTRCVKSVADALPANSKHIIIELDTDYDGFIEARYEAMGFADIIVFVDDDDYISKQSLELCLAALNETQAGMAYTREMTVFSDGLQRLGPTCTHYADFARSPSAIHHMAAVRSSAVTERSIALARCYGCGIEWIMKAEAALTQGAVHVPHVGYFYVQHPEQVSRGISERFARAIKPIGDELRSWRGRTGLIPVFNAHGGLV